MKNGGRRRQYLTESPSNVIALDPATGRPFWRYKRSLPAKVNVCCDQVNRGVAVLGDRVFVGTVDAHLVALSAPGAVLWDVEVADYRTGHSITSAPLIVKDMVITGQRHERGEVGGFFATLAETQEPEQFEPKELIAQDHTGVALGHHRWRVKSTGRRFESDFAHVFTIKNGKVVKFHEYFDTYAGMQAYSSGQAAGRL